MADTLTLIRPDDWHLHLRDDVLLANTVAATAAVFHRAIVMPNLAPPVTNVERARAYRERILAALPADMQFEPLMVIYLTDAMTPADIQAAAESGVVTAAKLYPAGATTHSDSGVRDPSAIYPLYEALEKYDLPLLLHAEVTDDDIDIFDREKVFIDRHLSAIRQHFPALRIVLEHVTTGDGVDFVQSQPTLTAATVTPQHLMMNRNDLLVGGIRPHNYCLPVLKRREHQLAIQQAVLSGDGRFFLGTDSAPHARNHKESACGCAGCFSAPAALPLYATFFDQHQALDKLEGFASRHGPAFYRLPENRETITLVRQDWQIPAEVQAHGITLIPWQAGQLLPWRLAPGACRIRNH